ncbi:MAG: hypothetical protein KAI64_06350, partial [Thermoplasmata archaeon]|nr:hypothetical protein [Thermoplasmata archaeon]
MGGTELLYMKSWTGDESGENPNYTREFDARVIDRGEGFVVLDKTLFYPLGGGQPSDTGAFTWEGGGSRVKEVRKKNQIRHFVDTVPTSDEV